MDRLDELQKIAESQRDEMARLGGRLDSLMEELKENGYNSVDEAEKALRLLNRKLRKRTSIYNQRLAEFEKKYANILQKTT